MQLRLLPFLAVLFFYSYTPAYALPELKRVVQWRGQGTTPYGPTDSFVYTHSHGRNSVGSNMHWDAYAGVVNVGSIATSSRNYDTSVHYWYKTGSQAYEPFGRYFQTFDANNNKIRIFFQIYDNSTSSWIDYSDERFIYNSDNTLASYLLLRYDKIAATWDSAARYSCTYFPGKLIATKIENSWNKNTLTWEKAREDSSDYDGAANLISVRTWSYVGPTWKRSLSQMTYNLSNQLISDTITIPGNGNIANTYFYNSMGLLTNSIRYDNGQKDTLLKIMYSYDASGNEIGSARYFFNTTTRLFTRADTNAAVYYSNGQIDYWTLTDQGSKTYQKFYYGAATGNVAAIPDANRMQLYPVPAVAYVNLQAELGAQQDISIMITDMTGRCVKQFKENAAGHYKKFIPLMELPAGTYTVTLSGRETTSRQINVIH